MLCTYFVVVRRIINLTLNARIGGLIFEGNYNSKKESNSFNPQVYKDLFSEKGTFAIKIFNILNKPPHTEALTKLIDAIQGTNTFVIYTNIQQSLQLYDQLKFYSNQLPPFYEKKLN